mmetsp:Transcript_27115/g.67755  ORF Transcript_27115/g.67755 Transcript_27115/m.67755 type:complete len:381 (-) Transcript_27115:564-1706(-)
MATSVAAAAATRGGVRTGQTVRARAGGGGEARAVRLQVSIVNITRSTYVPRHRRRAEVNLVMCGALTADADTPPPQISQPEVPKWHYRHLIDQGRVFQETFPVRFDEVGPDQRTTMNTVATMVQECACNHAQGLWGIGKAMPPGMSAENLGWVCARMHIMVDRYPRWGEQVKVKTWFEAQGRVAARRDWELTSVGNGGGEPTSVGVATSQWVAFNIEKRKMARIPASVTEDFKAQALPDSPVMGPEYTVVKLPDVRDVEGCSDPFSHSVRRSDMDMNGHVNNAVYVEWVLEAVPADMWDSHRLKELELEFRSECNYGDVVDALSCPEAAVAAAAEGGGDSLAIAESDNRVLLVHMLLKRGVGKREAEVVRARTAWEPRGG